MLSPYDLACRYIQETGTHIFLTGKAGTGKTTFLKQLPQITSKRMVVVAPTGVAAINAGGVTIHSFFQLPFSPFIPDATVNKEQKQTGKYFKEKQDIIRSLDLLVIDEISMVRADLLDAIDASLRYIRKNEQPFGGVQLLMIGDLQQLPPVVTDEDWNLLQGYYPHLFFFASFALKRSSFVTIELTKIFRQSDKQFIDILNSIRENKITDQLLSTLNQRHIPHFNPDEVEDLVILTTHNRQAQEINKRRMEELPDYPICFQAEIKGTFPTYSYPTEESLSLKCGAQVMFIKNDLSIEKRFYNGKIGKITSISKSAIEVTCQGEAPIKVKQEEWSNARYTIDKKTHEIKEVVEGVFKQYPLKPAWAITIHKSQGLTFEKAFIEANNSFAHGQVYVALSRCKDLNGLYLGTPIHPQAIINHRLIEHFSNAKEQQERAIRSFDLHKKIYYLQLLQEMFDFQKLSNAIQELSSFLQRYFASTYSQLTLQLETTTQAFRNEVTEVGKKFQIQLSQLIQSSEEYESDSFIALRVSKGKTYFDQKLKEIYTFLETLIVESDNKELIKRFNQLMLAIVAELNIKQAIFSSPNDRFSVSQYLHLKAIASIKKVTLPAHSKQNRDALSKDIINTELYNSLRSWRHHKAEEEKVPAYLVLKQVSLIAIANQSPATRKELLSLPQIGKATVEKYGEELLELISKCQPV